MMDSGLERCRRLIVLKKKIIDVLRFDSPSTTGNQTEEIRRRCTAAIMDRRLIVWLAPSDWPPFYFNRIAANQRGRPATNRLRVSPSSLWAASYKMDASLVFFLFFRPVMLDGMLDGMLETMPSIRLFSDDAVRKNSRGLRRFCFVSFFFLSPGARVYVQLDVPQRRRILFSPGPIFFCF